MNYSGFVQEKGELVHLREVVLLERQIKKSLKIHNFNF